PAMLTARGLWFLLIALVVLGTGIRIENVTLGILGLGLVLWFLWEWLLFALRVHELVRHLAMVRQVCDERGPVDSLWAGQTFRVRVQLQWHAEFSLPYVKINGRIPFGVDRVVGKIERDGSVARGKPLELSYTFHCPTPGRIRFEGLAVQLADLQGFFYRATFVANPRVY